MLDFCQVIKSDELKEIRKKAIGQNLNNKYAPEILSACFMQKILKNALGEGLNQIERAISLKRKVDRKTY